MQDQPWVVRTLPWGPEDRGPHTYLSSTGDWEAEAKPGRKRPKILPWGLLWGFWTPGNDMPLQVRHSQTCNLFLNLLQEAPGPPTRSRASHPHMTPADQAALHSRPTARASPGWLFSGEGCVPVPHEALGTRRWTWSRLCIMACMLLSWTLNTCQKAADRAWRLLNRK